VCCNVEEHGLEGSETPHRSREGSGNVVGCLWMLRWWKYGCAYARGAEGRRSTNRRRGRRTWDVIVVL